ncbi:MAG: DUF4388 domain-containing protein [Desulfobacterales bacterium]|nr:DUF4388 domain-containing protein [Desulfobacterales bacterium]
MSTLKGDIQSFPLAAVNRMIHSEKKTGRLAIASGQHQAEIFYQKGLIVFLNSDLTKAFSLGQLVRDHRIIGDQEMRTALATANSEGRRLGVTLVRLGYISKEKIVNLLRYQFKEVIATVLSWRAGSFAYTEGLTNFAADIRFEIDPVSLLAEAQKWRQYRDIIPDDRVIFKMADSRFLSDSSASEGVLRVMLLINGQRTVTQLIAETGYPRLAVYKAVKHLVSRGAIDRKGATDNGRQFDLASLVQFYLGTIEEILSVISLELGSQRSLDCLRDSLRSSGHSAAFMHRIPVDTDTRGRVAACMDFIESSPDLIAEKDLISGFDGMVSLLLEDVQRLLGERASAAASKRIDKATLLEIRNSNRSVAERTSPSGSGRALKTSSVSDSDLSAAPSVSPTRTREPQAAGQAAVLSFFCGALQILVQDLENEVGRQANSILQGILESFDAYPQFLHTYQAADDNPRNAVRMATCLKEQGRVFDALRLEEICREVLVAVVAEVRSLLGNGTVQRSLDDVEAQITQLSNETVKTQLRSTLAVLRK